MNNDQLYLGKYYCQLFINNIRLNNENFHFGLNNMTVGVQIQENGILSTNNKKKKSENPKEQPNNAIPVIFIFKSQTTIYIHPIINQKMQKRSWI